MNGAIEFLKTLGPSRLAAMGVVTALLLGFFGYITYRFSQPAMAPLYSDLSIQDSAAIVKELEAQNISYELRQEGGQILVPQAQVLRMRMRLAEKGVPAGASVGYEIFDKTDTLGTTSFVQNINHLRALEGELARTIRAIDGVQAARVHLVIPDRQLFQRDKKEPTAAIVLKVRGELEPQQVRAIQHLVSASVEGMKPGRVSVVDENGRLLAAMTEQDPAGVVSGSLQERNQVYERKLEGQIESIVTSVVGSGRARVRVAAEVDFNRVTQTEDKFDPNGQVVRSTQTKEENSTSAQQDKGVTVGNQVPGGQAQQGAGTRENANTTEELVNYEISKTSRTEVLEAGRVKRLSVAVLVDGVYTTAPSGEVSYQPRPQADLDRIAALVRSASGFDQARGDQVEVVNLRFAEPPASLPLEEKKSGFAALLDFTKDDIVRMVENGVLFLMTLLVLLFVVRPLVKQMVKAAEAPHVTVNPDGTLVVTTHGGPVVVGADGKPVPAGAGEGAAGVPALPAPEGLADPNVFEQARQAGALQATSIAKVGDMIKEMPNEAASIIRNWLNEAA